VDAPQLPDADASAQPADGQPIGQASAFRRALDAQVEASEPSKALVPSGSHDITAPINVDVLRALLASGKPADAPDPNAAPATAAIAGMTPVFPAPVEVAIPVLPTSAEPPSASGPTVVMPAVSAPALHAPTTIAPHSNADVPSAAPANPPANPAAKSAAPTGPAAFAGVPAMANAASPAVPNAAGGDHGGGGDGPPEHESSPRHNGRPSRLPTAVLISAVLGACAGVALVMFNIGHSPDPLAPTALPTMAATHSPSPSPSPTPKPSPKPSPSPPPKPSPSRASASPSHSPSPSPSATPSRASASPSPSTVASFATINWTTSPDPRVADIQRRLTKLGYLQLNRSGQYFDTYRTQSKTGWQPSPDGSGIYQNATDMAVRVFKYDYLQHDQGPPPGQGCDTRTYQALVNATS
jgi:hypothetical protein